MRTKDGSPRLQHQLRRRRRPVHTDRNRPPIRQGLVASAIVRIDDGTLDTEDNLNRAVDSLINELGSAGANDTAPGVEDEMFLDPP